MMNLYSILGISENATHSEIKKAFRELSKKHHPDVSGDSEKMTDINFAYSILKDKEKRKLYDTTGCVTDLNIREVAKENIKELFTVMVDQVSEEDVEYTDFLRKIRDSIKSTKGKFTKEISQLQKKETIYKKLQRNSKNCPLFEKSIEIKLIQTQRDIEIKKHHMEIGEIMLDLMKDYKYETPVKAERVRNTSVYDHLRQYGDRFL